jgi:hypothetical protein
VKRPDHFVRRENADVNKSGTRTELLSNSVVTKNDADGTKSRAREKRIALKTEIHTARI